MRGISFVAGGQEYSLAMTTNAMARYEAETGESTIAAFQRLEKEPSILLILGLFWASLTPIVSMDEAGDLIDEIGLAEATTLLGKAAQATFAGLSENPKKPSAKTRSTNG